jgi:hypothetical protein
MQTNSTAVTMTAACELGSHKCRGVVLSLTGASWDAQAPCSCTCHGITRNLPDAWAAQVAAYPPCDDDLDLAELTDDDEAALEAVAEMQVEAALEAAMFGAEL